MLQNRGIPYSISEYVNKNFREDFLFSCHRIKNRQGRLFFDVEVSKDGITHQLMFDEKGIIVKENFQSDFPADDLGEPFDDASSRDGDYLG